MDSIHEVVTHHLSDVTIKDDSGVSQQGESQYKIHLTVEFVKPATSPVTGRRGQDKPIWPGTTGRRLDLGLA
jgi:hypothetical protein